MDYKGEWGSLNKQSSLNMLNEMKYRLRMRRMKLSALGECAE